MKLVGDRSTPSVLRFTGQLAILEWLPLEPYGIEVMRRRILYAELHG